MGKAIFAHEFLRESRIVRIPFERSQGPRFAGGDSLGQYTWMLAA